MKLAVGDVLRNKLEGLIRVIAGSCTDPNNGEKYVFLRSTDASGRYEMGYWDEVRYVSEHYIKLKI